MVEKEFKVPFLALLNKLDMEVQIYRYRASNSDIYENINLKVGDIND